ncbi:hypothetical protein ACLPJF_07635 [Pseudomonas vlassakiae]|uniref:hypothetical protein n=1 Tax=Pseudomonas TaxID=286 RepID=UPI000E33114F|nr:hypothetical protein [Pseudomonas sp. UBA6554]AXQ49222.1 hypothetical protein DZC31_20535 [Stenotrophomonas rhizophila]
MGITIVFSPVRTDEQLVMSRSGDVLTLNGENFDFSPLLEGATLPREAILSDWFPGDVSRAGGILSLTVRLPHGPYAPEETRFPEPITIEVDGVVKLPPYGQPPEIDEPEESLSSEAQTDE